MLPIAQVAANSGIQPDELELFGESRAKIRLSVLDRLGSRPNGKMVIVTAVTPTKAGEGKTTTSVSLTMGLGKRNKKVVLCVREPSMGPVFGVKGGGTGGGKALVQPMEEINLLFNGDFPAVAAAHNLLAAAIDASIYNGNPLRIDIHSVMWPRTLDMNDRQLRFIVSGLGGKANGVPRESGFIITAASEVMVLVSAMHITAAVYVNDWENGLIHDFQVWLEKLAPSGLDYRHHQTGEDNADAHLKRTLMGHQVILPITAGKLDLGPWEQVFYAEFDGQRKKRVVVKVMGE